MERISVCMATYNGEKFIKEQISSILCQLNNDDELIISDDGSTDNTLNIIESFNSNQIILLRHQNKSKIYKNFENALINAKNEIIILSDQDDIWLENKIVHFRNALSNTDLIISNCRIINETGKIIEPLFYNNYSKFQKSFLGNLYKNTYLGCCMGFRKDMLNIILPFPEGISCHDSWIGLICKFYNKRIQYIDEPLIHYRKHAVNSTPTHEKSTYPLHQKIAWRVIFIFHILRRSLSRI